LRHGTATRNLFNGAVHATGKLLHRYQKVLPFPRGIDNVRLTPRPRYERFFALVTNPAERNIGAPRRPDSGFVPL
jgi:hypothetical protein